MGFWEELKYQTLSTQIWSDNEMQSALKEWWQLVNSAKEKNPELASRFNKEYTDLYEAIKSARENDKEFSKSERTRIMFELWDIVYLAEEKWVIESKSRISKFWDWLKWTDTESVKESAENLRWKKIESYSKDDAIAAINFLSNNYWNYEKVEADGSTQTGVVKWVTLRYHAIDELDDQYEVRLFQDILKGKIFWEWKEFNDEYLLWFNNDRWNFVFSISEFESELWSKNIRDINSKALSNYFLYLNSKWTLTLEKLISIFWENSLLDLKALWAENIDKDDTKKHIAKKALEKGWILTTITNLIEILSSPDKLLEKIWWTDFNNQSEDFKKQQALAMSFLEKNRDWLRDKMKNNLIEKFLKNNPWKSEEEAKEVIDWMLKKLLKCKKVDDIPKVLEIFFEYNKKYNLWINITQNTQELYNIIHNNAKLSFLEAQKKQKEIEERLEKAKISWNQEEVNAIRLELEIAQKDVEVTQMQKQEAEIAKKVAQNIEEKDEKEILSWKMKSDDLIQRTREKDKTFDEEYKKYQEEKKKFEEKYPELADKKDENKNENEAKPGENILPKSNESWNNEIKVENKWSEYIIYVWEDKQWITLTWPEYENLKDSPEKLLSVAEFYKELNELWLSFVWDFRNFLQWNILWFNISDWVWEWELLKLYNFVWKQIWKNWETLLDARNDFRLLNIWKWAEINSKINWEDLIVPESKIDNIWKTWVLYKYLEKNWYFNNWAIVSNKWIE